MFGAIVPSSFKRGEIRKEQRDLDSSKSEHERELRRIKREHDKLSEREKNVSKREKAVTYREKAPCDDLRDKMPACDDDVLIDFCDDEDVRYSMLAQPGRPLGSAK